MVSVATIFIGLGYILPSLATVVMLNYFVSQYPIESLGNIYMISGLLLFIIASILLMTVGVIIVIGSLQYFVGRVPREAMFLGILLSSFYLLCLGIGSSLIQQHLSLSLWMMIAGSVLAMASTAVYVAPSPRFKVAGSLIGIVGGVLLAIAIHDSEILGLVFNETRNWNVPFPGPFMSITILEGFALILGSVTALVHSVARSREKPVTYVFLSIVALVYGIGVFIGPLILSFSFLNLVWKAPWELALHWEPYWVVNTVIFWVASLGMIEIGGIVLILSSCLGFVFAVTQFSRP
ncbi:MAG: hypothetical protein ACE5J6_03395 [Candidatus Bathyarchaeia archaeon]